MKNILLNGSLWAMEEIDEQRQMEGVEEALSFGNHKGVTKMPYLLRKLTEKVLIHGCSLTLSLVK
eukprot:7097400-Ditylum_brightwellii.AAC.2